MSFFTQKPATFCPCRMFYVLAKNTPLLSLAILGQFRIPQNILFRSTVDDLALNTVIRQAKHINHHGHYNLPMVVLILRNSGSGRIQY